MTVYIKRVKHEVYVPRDEMIKVVRQYLSTNKNGCIVVPEDADAHAASDGGMLFQWQEKKGE